LYSNFIKERRIYKHIYGHILYIIIYVYIYSYMKNFLPGRINIKFWRSKLEFEIKRNSQWIQIKYKTYMCHTDMI